MYTTLVWQSQTGQNKYTKPLYSLEGLTVPSAKRLIKIQRIWPWDFFLPILSSTNSLTINFIVPYPYQSWTGYYLMCGPMWLVLAVIIGSPESMSSYRQNPGLTSRYISMCLLAIFWGPSKNRLPTSSTISLTINCIVPYLDQSWTGYYLMCGPMGLVLTVIIGSPESMPSYRQTPGLLSRYISMCMLEIVQGPSKHS